MGLELKMQPFLIFFSSQHDMNVSCEAGSNLVSEKKYEKKAEEIEIIDTLLF